MFVMRIAILTMLFIDTINSAVGQFTSNTRFYPCGRYIKPHEIFSEYQYENLPVGEENQYNMTIIYRNPLLLFVNINQIILKFDADVSTDSLQDEDKRYSINLGPRYIKTRFIPWFGQEAKTYVTVKGADKSIIPYVTSIIIDRTELCRQPNLGYLDKIVQDYRIARQVWTTEPDNNCGIRKLDINELIMSGQSAKHGDWPWHVAVYRVKGGINAYICGGTLISKYFVLTAAHCAINTYRLPVVPDLLNIHLGKYHLLGGDISIEEREVYAVIVHENFDSPARMDNDIALLKLKTEAVYSNYVQPACVWSSKTSQSRTSNPLSGTVVGWGAYKISKLDLSPHLLYASLPMVSDLKCVKKNPLFYGTLLSNEKKFCAGWTNGTSPCNGDSGSGFIVNVLDASGVTGVWYIRGIVSVSKPIPNTNICDPEQYVVFTDISKYEDWIRDKMN